MMKTFRYTAIDPAGHRSRGTIQAENRDEAINLLRRQKLTVIALSDEGESPAPVDTSSIQSLLDFFGFTFVSHKDMAMFTRKFAGMISAGIGYAEIFDILCEETENRRLTSISGKIAEDLRKGENVYEALSKHPDVFSKVYRSMINAGEHTGRLDHIMNQLADMYDEEHELRSQVLSKLYFPIFYLMAALLLIAGGIYIVPRFFGEGANLFPQSLFNSVVTIWLSILIIILIGRTKPGYRVFRTVISYIPPFNGVLKKMSLARFSRLFAAMFASGVPIMTGLDIAGETLMEPDLAAGIERVKQEVLRGEDLATALARSNVFPKSLRGMVRTGEIAGSIETMLNKAAEYYEIDIRAKSSMLASIFTLLVMLAVLLTIAAFVISAWSNYYGMIDELINENT